MGFEPQISDVESYPPKRAKNVFDDSPVDLFSLIYRFRPMETLASDREIVGIWQVFGDIAWNISDEYLKM